mmetsp:Transcript_10757/g.14884  ORF Transcript_10757/g.14884 Transcript_10757/m.14884 type:complete len:211 (+) Transcript_10757:85-717(+)|eukprot:CAMPEP_0185280800 /NCGR_PEP_ID=MMETSP1359-20130426/66355_1 /TAXON_ID=552665 /ORGANISM="Bigelowiella longifila, Strain CCMP242" /LENGTH=210 /DNA_ID=CAMNT_0027876143 /DNA_START=39 /DNA_END=671 /DNA_ORIENTATION=-
MESKGGRMAKMRIVVLGSGAVGKSSLIVRLTTGHFFEDYDPTIEDCHIGSLSVDGQPVRLEILDTAGQGDFHSSFLDQWIERAQGVLMVYSIDNPHSMEELHDIRDRILLSKDDEKFPIVLVGNKSDIGSKRMVDAAEGRRLAQKWGCAFWETSAKDGVNLVKPFSEVVREIRIREKRKTEGKVASTSDMEEHGCSNASWSAFMSSCTIL